MVRFRLLLGVLVGTALLVSCGSDSAAVQSPSPSSADSPTAGAPPRSTGTAASRGTAATPPAALGLTEHDGAATMRHIEQLATVIGPRVSGTEGEQRAAAYIEAEFRSLGYLVERQEFDIDGFGFGSVTVSGDSDPLASVSLSGSAAANVEGPVVFVGLADPAGIRGQDLRGAVVVADRGTLTFMEKYDAVAAAGAAALIIVNNADGLFSGRLQRTATIPVVGIGREDRDRLLGGQATRAKVSVTDALKGVNIVARPSADPGCRVLVGGHHDTVPGVPGATDNASGTSHTLELARAFAADGLDAGLCFATFGGEEEGLFGSKALAQQWSRDNLLPEYFVNLDVTATGTAIEAIGDADLQRLVVELAAARGATARATNDPPNTGSDHISFRQAGVAVVFLAGNDFANIHTPQDTASRTNPELVEQIGDVAYALVSQLLDRVARR